MLKKWEPIPLKDILTILSKIPICTLIISGGMTRVKLEKMIEHFQYEPIDLSKMNSVQIHNFSSTLVESKNIIEIFHKSDKIIFSNVEFTSYKCAVSKTLESIELEFDKKEILFENPIFKDVKKNQSEKDLKNMVQKFGAIYKVHNKL